MSLRQLHFNILVTRQSCNKAHTAVRPQKHRMLDDMPALCLGAVAGRAEVLSPSSFWLRSAADADLTDVWMCYRRYDTVTHGIRTLSASEDTAAG